MGRILKWREGTEWDGMMMLRLSLGKDLIGYLDAGRLEDLSLCLFLFNAMISFSIFSLVVKSVLVNGHHNENKSAMEVVLKSSPTSCFNVLRIRRTL